MDAKGRAECVHPDTVICSVGEPIGGAATDAWAFGDSIAVLASGSVTLYDATGKPEREPLHVGDGGRFVFVLQRDGIASDVLTLERTEVAGSFTVAVRSLAGEAVPSAFGVVDRVAIADFDGDGSSDVVVVQHDRAESTLRVFRRSAGGFSAWGSSLGAAMEVETLIPADLDGDHRPELVLMTRSPGILPAGDLQLRTVQIDAAGVARWSGTTPMDPVNVLSAVADLDGDGRDDVIVRSLNGGLPRPDEITAFLATPQGGLGTPLRSTLRGRAMGGFHVMDINGDRKPDLVVDFDHQELAFMLGRGDGTFQDGKRGRPDGAEIILLGLVDARGDGHADAWISTPSGVRIVAHSCLP